MEKQPIRLDVKADEHLLKAKLFQYSRIFRLGSKDYYLAHILSGKFKGFWALIHTYPTKVVTKRKGCYYATFPHDLNMNGRFKVKSFGQKVNK